MASALRCRRRILFFKPGHGTFPIYCNETVQQVIANGVRWAAPVMRAKDAPVSTTRDPIKPIA